MSTEQVRQILRASMTARAYAVGNLRVAQWFFTLIRRRELFPLFLKGSTSLQSVSTKRTAAAKTSLEQSVSTTTEALLHFHGTGYIKFWLQDHRPHFKLHWKTNMMSNISRVPREEVPYQEEGPPRARNLPMWKPEQKNVS